MDSRKFGLGARLSPEDTRDYKAVKAPYRVLQTLPDLYLLGDSAFQPIRQQGDEGTCVGHAAADGVLGYYVQKQNLNRTLSPRDAYQGGRSLEDPIPPDTRQGTYPRAVFKYIQKAGVCREEDWPYVEKVPGTEFASAADQRPLNKVFSYAAVNLQTSELKATLMQNGPLLICVPVYLSFYNANPNTGIIVNPGNLSVDPDGYHAITVCGWDNSKGWRIRNSWGTDWGQQGYAWLPFDYPIAEAWTVIPALLDKLPTPEPTPIPEPAPVNPEPSPIKYEWPWWIKWLMNWLGW